MKSREKSKFRILFVCEGNTCRSPMAEAALRAKIPQSLIRSLDILSAGLSTFNGLPATEEAQLVAGRKGYDLTGHRSRQISADIVESSHLILCMEPAQARYLQERFPGSADRIYALLMFAGGRNEPIEDPYLKSLRVYIKTMNQIDSELKRCKTSIWNRVRNRARCSGNPPDSNSA